MTAPSQPFPPEAVEAAARALWDHAGGQMEFLWTEVSETDKRKYAMWTIAALTAAAPFFAAERDEAIRAQLPKTPDGYHSRDVMERIGALAADILVQNDAKDLSRRTVDTLVEKLLNFAVLEARPYLDQRNTAVVERDAAIDATNKLIRAWESLPGGRDYTVHEVQAWLMGEMKPAFDIARAIRARSIVAKSEEGK